MRSLVCPSMEDLLENVMVDILSRLPVKTIIHCKCVCKKWRNIVFDSYFAHLQLLRSPAGIMIHHISEKGYLNPGILKWVEVEDELNHHNLHHDPVMSLDLNLAPVFQGSRICPAGSVNGLIWLWKENGHVRHDNTYICNPMTREYMILPTPRHSRNDYGFGVCSLTQEYKVIRFLRGKGRQEHASTSEAEVYIVSTGQWRSLGHVPYSPNNFSFSGTFLNGHAHWTAFDRKFSAKIFAFDFDKETFQWFPSPPDEESQINIQSLGVVKGCLCRCDSNLYELRIWVMKEYGIKKSWHKDVIIKQGVSPDLDLLIRYPVYLIEGLKDGTILMISCVQKLLLAYCPRRKTAIDTKLFDGFFNGLAYRPSFHRLHNFENERVHVF